jgi:hypothetical protein
MSERTGKIDMIRFGHQEPIQAIDALMRERCVTAGGRDGSLRLWKIVEESHLMFTGHKYVMHSVLNEKIIFRSFASVGVRSTLLH